MLSAFLRSIFRFRKTSVSLLLVTTYLVLGLLFTYDHYSYKHVVPSSADFHNAPALLDSAWLDLQVITKGFHPYFTRENSRVHDYLLGRIRNLTESAEFVEIYDDVQNKASLSLKSNDVFNPSSKVDRAYFFESANILAKVKGKNDKLPGILLSAHYDSVPTSHGATDDGKGIVSLLGVLEHFSKKQPERTIIFNFNNNEEFGLLGAEAFMEHPWAKLVKYVINLEGTGTGSKAVMFRASDTSLAKIYQQAVRKSPFGNSIYQQGFNDGNVGSQTDYVVYTKYGLRGLDIAFYKPRDLYHTIKDSTQYTSKEALWHMLHTTWQITDYLSRNENIDDVDITPAVFFDVLGLKFFAFSANTLFKWNCVILIICPLLISVFDFLGRKKDSELKSFWNIWSRLPISLGISIGIVCLTQYVMITVNPFVISRNYFLPLFTLSAEFVVANYLVLSFWEFISPIQDFKTTIFHQLTVILWFALLRSTILLYRKGYKGTGTYVITFLFLLMSLGTMLGYACRIFKKMPTSKRPDKASNLVTTYGTRSNGGPLAETDLETGSRDGHDLDDADSVTDNEGAHEGETTLDERAPLLETGAVTGTDTNNDVNQNTLKVIPFKSLNYDWSMQFLMVFPLATFILLNALDLVLDALHQTIQEGETKTFFTWNIVLVGGIILSLPLLPFAYKINHILGLFFLATFFGSLLLSLMVAPFTAEAPMKVRFSQEINLANEKDAIVRIHGRQNGLTSTMLKDLPSVKENGQTVWCEEWDNGMERCSYRGLTPNLIDSTDFVKPSDLFSVKILENDRTSADRSLYAPINARFRLKVRENRACSLWFNSSSQENSPVRQVTLYKNGNNDRNKTESENIRINTGINQLHLFKLDFDALYYDIGVQWLPKIVTADPSNQLEEEKFGEDDVLGVHMTCYWAEYDAESIVADEHLRKIPAYDELLEYAPLNYSFVNNDKGLVLISNYLEL